jgi:SpoVK/Ycf46/Vps4 family AAA+-type ATPase
VSDALLNRISTTLTGLTASQISQSLAVALEKHGELDEKALAALLQEKEQIIGKSGVLEMVKVRENLTDIGGLENLKKWLERKAAILQRLPEAEEAGLQAPKGVLVAGMPGCGKSLTAKAVANLFGLPLLRLDIGSLLGKYVGRVSTICAGRWRWLRPSAPAYCGWMNWKKRSSGSGLLMHRK